MFEQMTLKQYNEILASKSPTPGGGSALAVVGTIACSLVEMSVNVTLTKLTEGEIFSLLQRQLTFFARAKNKLQQLADEDAEAFQNIITCMHLPKDSEEQKRLRTQQLQKAYHKAAIVPLDVMRVCKECFLQANKIFDYLYKYVASDCKIGIDLFLAIVQNSMENVFANTCLISDLSLKKMLEQQGNEILRELKI